MIKFYIIGMAAFGALLIGAYFLHQTAQQARVEEQLKQEKANAEFRVRAAKGAVDFDTCDRADGVYNFGKGTCQLPGTLHGSH
jgi:hypothetical protein